MTIIVVNQAEEAFLDLILGVNYTLRLFTNDPTTGLTTSQIDALDESDFTEATFPGYSAAAIAGGTWTTTQADPSTGTNSQQMFTRSSTGTAQLVRGYYLTTTTGGFLRWFEKFPAPISVEFINDQVAVTPRITLDDSGGNEVHPGIISPFGGTTAPTGWLLCDGSAVSRTTYADLFAVVSTTYGVGDGSTTFNLPDLRQRFPLGKAASGTGQTLGSTGGAIDHTHDLNTATSHARILLTTVGNSIRSARKAVSSWTSTHDGTGVTVVGGAAGQTLATELAGDTATANAPFQVVNYLIKT